jgi:pilus assembly protein Flp/PilA
MGSPAFVCNDTGRQYMARLQITPTKPCPLHWRNVMFSQFEDVLAFIRAEEGVTAIEYGLIAALIALLIIAGATLVGQKLSTIFDLVQSALTAAA